MKKIALTQGKFALVDDEDYDFLMQWKWYANDSRGVIYARSWGPYAGAGQAGKRAVLMHNYLLGFIGIDHIDGNGLNNTKLNLRKANQSQNTANTGKRKNNKSGFKGVSQTKKSITKPWVAQIRIGTKNCFLGYFKTPEEASEAYKEAAKKHHGEFAKW